MKLPADLRDCLEVCQRGEFYEEIADMTGVDYSDDAKRQRLKEKVYCRISFGATPWPGDVGIDLWRAFRKRWPTVANLLERLKEADHAVPARVCQRLEAGLMIHDVCDTLRVQYPDIPVILIHDGVHSHKEHMETIERVIRSEYARVGLFPSLH